MTVDFLGGVVPSVLSVAMILLSIGRWSFNAVFSVAEFASFVHFGFPFASWFDR